MTRRAPLVLVALVLAAGPLLWLAFGRGSATAQPLAADQGAPGGRSCEVRSLAYGLTDDPGAGRAYQGQALFGAHPPLPRPGYYADGQAPEPDAVLHALSHRWVVSKYRPGVDARGLATGKRTIVISGGADMPFALGAVAWGEQLTCEDSNRQAVAAFARRHHG
jgi:uncharacterized protein DUF3105